MTYAKVIENEIVEYNRTLPFSTENTSFGVGTDAETLKEFGYLPIVGSEPEYDRSTHKVESVSYVVGEAEVSKVYVIVPKTQEQINEEHNAPILAQLKEIKLDLQVPNMMLAVGTDAEKLEAAQTLRDYYTQIKALEAQLL